RVPFLPRAATSQWLQRVVEIAKVFHSFDDALVARQIMPRLNRNDVRRPYDRFWYDEVDACLAVNPDLHALSDLAHARPAPIIHEKVIPAGFRPTPPRGGSLCAANPTEEVLVYPIGAYLGIQGSQER